MFNRNITNKFMLCAILQFSYILSKIFIPYQANLLKMSTVNKSQNRYGHLNLIYTHASSRHTCIGSSMEEWSFVREYFDDKRAAELQTAIRHTIAVNICARFIFLVQDTKFVDALKSIAKELDVNVVVYSVLGVLTMSHLFESALLSKSTNFFVVSTCDVAISSVHHLASGCELATNTSNLLVISRRDNDTTKEECFDYRGMNSFDVYIGHRSMISEEVLRSLIFSPTYWGVENLTAYILSQKNVFNLCPYVDAIHFHSSGKGQPWRPRINHKLNSATSQNASSVCDIKVLEKSSR